MKKKLILLSLIFISLFGCTNTNSSLSDKISNNSIFSSSISSVLSTTSIEDNKTFITFNTEDSDINNWFICSNDINFKLDNDPRITKIGNFLRRSSIDELPQLINILNGSMSIVGPRPIVEKEIALYGEYAPKLFSVVPGLTGYWQANGRSDTTYQERIKMDMYYIDNRSLGLDLKIIFKTFSSVIKGEGAI